MVINKKLSNIDHGVGIIKNAIIDNIIERIKTLDLDEETYLKVVNIFDDEKADVSIRKKKNEVNDKPKKVIPKERRCTRKSKDGKTCGALRTNDVTKSCWAHMSQAEKDEHAELKSSSKHK
jgi:predicted RNA-binding protein with RPS1 domain